MKIIKNKKVVIFGVTGNCGRKIAETLIHQNCEVFGVGRSSDPQIPKLSYIKGDICDSLTYDFLPKSADMVINLAGVQPSILNTSENTDLAKTLSSYINVNVVGVFNVLEYVRRNKIPIYFYTTTHRDYEKHWRNGKLLGNNLPIAINFKGDHSMYAISKTSAKMMGDYYSESFGIRAFNLRLPMIFLVPQKPTYLKDGVPTVMPFLQIIRKALDGEDLEIWGDPNLKRDYVHINNLINLIELCYSSKLKRGTFNVGTGEAVTTEEFVRTVAEVFSKSPTTTKFIYRPEIKTYKCACYDVSEQKKQLGYVPIYLKEMLLTLKSDIEKLDCISRWGW